LEVTNGEPGERKWVLSRGGVGYKVGDFCRVNEKWTFVADSHYASNDGIMNYGNDAYAMQTYSTGNFDLSQRVIAINWQNFRAPNIGKDNGNHTFNGQMTLQNELSLYKDTNGRYLLQQTSLVEYETLRDSANALTLTAQTVNGIVPLDFTGQSYEIIAEFDVANATEVGFRVRSGNDYYTRIAYNVARNRFYNDRSRTGTGGYRDIFSQTPPKSAVADGKLKLRIFVDRNCVAVFGADNTVVGSTLIYPAPDCDGLEVFSTGEATLNTQIFPMRSIWNNTGDNTGIGDVKIKKNDIDIQLTGKTLRINTLYQGETNVRIYDLLGKLQEDFGQQRKNEYPLSFLHHGVYIVSVKTPVGSKNQKIVLNKI